MGIKGDLIGGALIFFSPPHFKQVAKSWCFLAAWWRAEAAYRQEHVPSHRKA